MESLLNRLYAALGLDAPEDEPLLIIDDGIQVYLMNPIIHWKCAVPLCHCLTTS